MDLDKDDLAALCEGLTKDEVDRVHRLIHEWNVGPMNSFPVQLALLTNAQWRIAANLPRLMNDSRKLLELHLAEYRRQGQAETKEFAGTARQLVADYRAQTAALTDKFAGMVDIKHGELKAIVLKHAETVKRDALFVSNRLLDANDAAKNIQKSLEAAAAEWTQSKDDLAKERLRFEKICQKLDDAINLRGVHWYIIGTMAACVIALLIGHYVWHR